MFFKRKKDSNIRGILEEHVSLLNTLKAKVEEIGSRRYQECAATISDLRDEVKILKEDRTSLCTKIRALNAAKGGYQKRISELEEELLSCKESLDEAEKELKSTYRVKRVPSGRKPSMKCTVTPKRQVNGQVNKMLADISEVRDEEVKS